VQSAQVVAQACVEGAAGCHPHLLYVSSFFFFSFAFLCIVLRLLGCNLSSLYRLKLRFYSPKALAVVPGLSFSPFFWVSFG
jgi:hypothetical protein